MFLSMQIRRLCYKIISLMCEEKNPESGLNKFRTEMTDTGFRAQNSEKRVGLMTIPTLTCEE